MTFSCQIIRLALSIYYLNRLTSLGLRGSCSHCQLSPGQRWATSCTGCQSISGMTYRDRQPLSPTVSLESQARLLSQIGFTSINISLLMLNSSINGENVTRYLSLNRDDQNHIFATCLRILFSFNNSITKK